MKPALAAHLIDAFVPLNGRVLDPFSGSGTIPLEAAIAGRAAYAIEISPLAAVLTNAKIGRPRRDECQRLLQALALAVSRGGVTEAQLLRASSFGFNGKLVEYYEPKTLREIIAARSFFARQDFGDPSTALVLSALLHVLHGNRPYALSRRSHPITPFAPSGEFEYRSLVAAVTQKVQRSLSALDADPIPGEGKTFWQDATEWWPAEVDELDAVITSPPFFDSTRFHLANWLRLWFCGWEADDFRSKPLGFVDELQKTSFNVYGAVFRQARERMKPGGYVVLHLGRSGKCDMAEMLAGVARPWFRVIDRFAESVDHCESHGIRDKGSVTDHQYLVLR